MFKICSFFYTGEKQKQSYPYANLEKNHHVERAQYALLGHSKTLCFHDVSKIEILQVTVLHMLTVHKLCFALVNSFPLKRFA